MRIVDNLQLKSVLCPIRIFSILLLSGLGCSSAVYADDIPVNRVILSTSGLAQFEHHTKVTGDATVEFPVRLDQVDDILKSLVVFDAKGRLGSVTLPGKQPLDQIFKDMPFNRGQLGSAMMLLNAYQGAVVTIKGADLTATGKIIQVVPEDVALENNKTITKHRLSLMTDAGMKQTILEDLVSLQFEDKKIQSDIGRALDSIRENSTSDRRVLSVNLLGKEPRDVTLSYVVPSPLWKTAYRMVVPETGKEKGLLQGWAIVENMTAADWKNVDLSLVSGNPVTFHQALYPSYYVDRPDVPVQVFGMALPRVDQGEIASAGQMQDAEKKAAMKEMGGMRYNDEIKIFRVNPRILYLHQKSLAAGFPFDMEGDADAFPPTGDQNIWIGGVYRVAARRQCIFMPAAEPGTQLSPRRFEFNALHHRFYTQRFSDTEALILRPSEALCDNPAGFFVF